MDIPVHIAPSILALIFSSEVPIRPLIDCLSGWTLLFVRKPATHRIGTQSEMWHDTNVKQEDIQMTDVIKELIGGSLSQETFNLFKKSDRGTGNEYGIFLAFICESDRDKKQS